ncbi:beta-ketoacyl synthase N-terminal-like domain-containing protein [Clostridium felsineum]|uniref:Uncharacterized protein n=1 Tax=Clostridium felsineum TaxID=36839 RepID=A0A1S8MHV3_9CLOT|nr:beta-ketoacyl synthase N-terminal-like domain-containing protein [Clostridium felsineum]URZ07162.1 hypothetical protein CLROS_024950 [Clostridium felsineum]URZ12192.1 hypothetical protein CROST_029090 [Clostridium felsineum]
MNLDILNKIDITEFSDEDSSNKNAYKDESIAIIGMSVKAPCADNVEEFWDSLKVGKECVRAVPQNRKKFNIDYLEYLGYKREEIKFIYANYIEEIDKFDYEFFNINPKEAELMDPGQRLFLQTAWEAIEDAGCVEKKLSNSKTGVYVGYGDDSEYLNIISNIDHDVVGIAQTGNIKPILASRLSYLLNLKGPSMIIDTTCSSSLTAIHIASQALKSKECDMAIAGGVSIRVLPSKNHSSLGVESKNSRVKTFDDSSNGTLLGEGIGVVILKTLSKAIEDKDNIYGVIKASSLNQDGKSSGITAPNQIAQEELITTTWQKAGISPTSLSYIEAHGTGTKLGDPIEIKGIKRAFEMYTDKKQFCAIGSIKPNVGHSIQASGVIGVIKVLLMMKYKTIPPLINFDYPNKSIKFEDSPLFINNKLRKLDDNNGIIRCGISSFGVSGTNAHMILEKDESLCVKDNDKHCDSYILTLSAKNKESLEMLVNKYKNMLKNRCIDGVGNICYTANVRRNHYNYRMAIVFKSVEELYEKLSDNKLDGVYYNKNFLVDKLNKDKLTSEANSLIDNNISSEKLSNIAKLYIEGADVDFSKLYEEKSYKVVHVPTYQFKKNICWIKVPKKDINKEKKDINKLQQVKFDIDDTIILSGRSNGLYTRTEKVITTILKKLMGINKIGINDRFSDMGGDSIVLTKFHEDLKKVLGIEFSIADIFSYPTIGKLGKYLDNNFANIENETQNKEPKMVNNDTDIAVIGISAKLPAADSVEEYWDNMISERECIVNFPRDRKKYANKYLRYSGKYDGNVKYIKCGYMKNIDEFDWKFFNISPKEANIMDPHQRLFLQEAWKTIEDAGYSKEEIAGTKTGVYLGYANDFAFNYWRIVNEVDEESFKLAVGPNLSSVIPSRISYLLDLKGPSMLVDTACASSLVAVHLACQAILNGECEMALAGGARVEIMPICNEYNKLGVESSSYHLRAFDNSSDGIVWGEGVASLLLKPLKKAREDGDHIYAVIKGSTVNQDGASMGISTPNPEAQTQMIVDCLKNTNINPETIDYIECHGTGTEIGDPIEVNSITNAYKQFTSKKQFCGIGSIKSSIGHCNATSGIAAVIKMVLALKYKELPASINWEIPNSKINFENSPVYFLNKSVKWAERSTPRRCAINSFGFSGTNCHVILEEENSKYKEESDCVNLFVLSSKSANSLWEYIKSYSQYLKNNTCNNITSLCYTASCGRSHYKYRLALVVKDIKDLENKINKILDNGYETFIKENNNDSVEQASYENIDNFISLFIDNGRRDKMYLEQIARYYKEGAEISWKRLYSDKKYTKVSIPTYIFEKTKCWVEIPEKNNESYNAVQIIEEIMKKSELSKELTEELNNVLEEFKENREVNLPNKKQISIVGRESNNYTEVEVIVAEIWCDVLGLDEIDINVNFYEVGGHSIAMMQIVSKINKKLKTNLSYSEFNEQNSVKTLAQMLESKEKSITQEEYLSITPDPSSMYDSFPITDIQMSYLLGRNDSFEMGGVAPQVYMEIETSLDIKRLNRSLNKLIARHPMLRAVVDNNGTQHILEGELKYNIEITDISQMNNEEIEKYITEEREKVALKSFKADEWPLIRIVALKINDKKHHLFIAFDTLIMDGSSLRIIGDEWISYYKNENLELPKLELTFRDYMLALEKFNHSKMYENDKKYWLEKLEDFPKAPELLYKVNPSDISNPSFKRLSRTYNKENWGKIKDIAKELGVSPSSLLCTAYAEVLAYWSNQSRFTVSLTVFNRLPFHKDVDKIVGDFTSVMLIPINFNNEESFFDRVKNIHKDVLNSLEHRSFDGVEMIRKIAVRDKKVGQPVMPIVFTSMLFDGEYNPWSEFGETKIGMSQTPQVYIDHQAGEIGGELVINWDYVSEIFDKDVINNMFNQYVGILDYLISINTEEDK